MEKVFTLGVLLKAIDHLTGPLRTAAAAVEKLDTMAAHATHLHKLSASMQSFGQDAIVAGGVVGAALLGPIKAMSDFDDATRRARSTFLMAAGDDPLFGAIKQDAIQLGNIMPGTTADFLRMAVALKQGNVSSASIAHGALEAAADLSVIVGNLAPEEAAKLIATFRQSLGIAQTDFVRFTDQVQRAKSAFGLDPSEFAEGVKYVAPILKSMGVTGYESSKSILALAGSLSQAGIRGETFGTSLRATLLMLPGLNAKIKASSQLTETLSKAGIHFQFFKGGKFAGMENFIAQIGKLKALSQQQQLSVLTQLFGQEPAAALAVIAQQGTAGYQHALQVMAQQASMSARLKIVLGSFKNIWEGAMGTITNTLAAFGQTMQPALVGLAKTLNTLTAKLGAWIGKHPQLTKAIGLSMLALSAFLVVVGGGAYALGGLIKWIRYSVLALGKIPGAARLARVALTFMKTGVARVGPALAAMARSIYAALVPALTTAASSVWAFTVALQANPIVWIIEGIVALGVAAFLVVKYWGPISAFFKKLWVDIKQAFGAAINWITHLDLFTAGTKILSSLWQGMKHMASKPIELMKEVAGKIRDFLPFSPAKVGPLRDLGRVRIMETIAGTMRPAPMTAAMQRAATLTMAAGLAIAPVPAFAGSIAGRAAPIHVSPVTAAPVVDAELRSFMQESLHQQRALLDLHRQFTRAALAELRAIRTADTRGGRGDY